MIASVQGHCARRRLRARDVLRSHHRGRRRDVRRAGKILFSVSRAGAAVCRGDRGATSGRASSLYSGDTIDAETALAWGMVNRVVPVDELKAATMKYAKRLALIAPEAPAAASSSRSTAASRRAVSATRCRPGSTCAHRFTRHARRSATNSRRSAAATASRPRWPGARRSSEKNDATFQ